ncbi:hypothetical protein JKF63_02642 [Porcisia hertigi]|uniref:Exonuclease domain-containing protein n=1 Tax=Porcisia hertigi TaxID=2761500 RepID=A0A836L6D5_9TRYP|nr:hypothetical protein JKF63_02642 [Porcisia hertigi]
MDDFSARIERFRRLRQQRRPREGTVSKEGALAIKSRSGSIATASSTSDGIEVLVAGWMGCQGPQKLNQTSSEAPHFSGLTHFPPSPLRLVACPNSDVRCGGHGSGSPFAPASLELRPLLADTIGLLALPKKEDQSPGTPTLPHPSAPVVDCASGAASASVAFSCVVLDLETTGFSPTADEILEVGCVELQWTPPSPSSSTGSKHVGLCAPPLERQSICADLGGLWTRGRRVFHRYVRPSNSRRISAAATAVHGITWEMVQHCAPWSTVACELVAFLVQIRAETPITTLAHGEGLQLGGSCAVHLPPLVVHNASFDARFLEHHLRRCGYQIFWHPHYPLTCTRQWAQVAYPHVANNLDALCAFLRIDGAADRSAHHHGALTDAKLTALLFLQMCRHWTERFGGAE